MYTVLSQNLFQHVGGIKTFHKYYSFHLFQDSSINNFLLKQSMIKFY